MINLIKKLLPNKLKAYVRNITLKGNNVRCPICKKGFLTFLPYGVSPAPMRPNALCPNCGSLERTRIYWKYLCTIENFFNKKIRILHFAPEKQLFKRFSLIENFEYHPVDKYPEGYPEGTKSMDITQLNYPENYFDLVICSHVLEHVPDDATAMKEILRVLKVDGWGLLQVPMDMTLDQTYEDFSITNPEGRQKAFGQFDHVRIYGKDYKSRLEDAGFVVELNSYASDVSAADRFKYGFGEGENLYLVRKS